MSPCGAPETRRDMADTTMWLIKGTAAQRSYGGHEEMGMQRIARLVMELLAALTIMLALGCATALARPTHGALFRYLVGDLPSGARVSVSFTSQAQGRSGQASVISGSMSTMEFNANGMQVVSAGPDPLSATLHQQLLVAGQTLTGTATVPAGCCK